MKKFKKFGVIGFLMFALALCALFTNNKSSAEASLFKKHTVKLYKGNANANGFDTKTVKIKNLTAYSIIKELKAYGAVASNVKANSLDYKGKYLTLDLSKEFAEDICKMGTSGEYVRVGAVVNTFLDAFKVDTLTITVEGKAWDSGHVTYDSPMGRFGHHITLYMGNANADGFETINTTINNKTAYSIIQELKAAGAVASKVKAKSLKYVNGKLTLDLSKEFAKDVCSSGTSGEYIKVGCVVNTFLDAFEVDTLTITVEGKAWESGHVVYDGPLSRFQ